MKATGIVRRIDELGRIVIPKEIRRTFKIKEGSPLEIFCGDNNELVLKKYSMIFEIKDFADEICSALFKSLSCPILICDKEKFVACSGISKTMFYLSEISLKLEKIIEDKKEYILIKNNTQTSIMQLKKDDENCYTSQIIVPIISQGDSFGAIICFSKDNILGEKEMFGLKCMANFLSEQIG